MTDKEPGLKSAEPSACTSHQPDIVVVPIDDLPSDGLKDEPVTITGMAEDPLERAILEEIKWFHNECEAQVKLAQRAPTSLEAVYFERALTMSKHVGRLNESFRKYRRRSEYKMVVERHTVPNPSGRVRRTSARAVPQTNAGRSGTVRASDRGGSS
jgi:hypothetical protein